MREAVEESEESGDGCQVVLGCADMAGASGVLSPEQELCLPREVDHLAPVVDHDDMLAG